MEAIGSKLRNLEGGRIGFMCPGCDEIHQIRVQETGVAGGWTFNNDGNKPTFSPSILVRGTEPLTDDEYDRVIAGEKIHKPDSICHSFVTEGNIQFLGDCTHKLAGQTVELPNIN
jgi:hypothetical protein